MEENRNTSENVNESSNVGGAGESANAGNGSTISDSVGALADKGKDIAASLGKNAQILKWVCLGASIVVGLSALLPYASALGINVTLLESGSGYIFLLLAAVCIVFTFLKNQQQSTVILVCGVLAFIWNVREILSLSSDSLVASLVEKEIGYWLMLLSTLVLLAGSIINFIVNRQQGGGNAAG